MQKRKLEDLNLIDDFLFNKMISHPEFGEEFARDLIRIILGKEVGKLTGRGYLGKCYYLRCGGRKQKQGFFFKKYSEKSSVLSFQD